MITQINIIIISDEYLCTTSMNAIGTLYEPYMNPILQ